MFPMNRIHIRRVKSMVRLLAEYLVMLSVRLIVAVKDYLS